MAPENTSLTKFFEEHEQDIKQVFGGFKTVKVRNKLDILYNEQSLHPVLQEHMFLVSHTNSLSLLPPLEDDETGEQEESVYEVEVYRYKIPLTLEHRTITCYYTLEYSRDELYTFSCNMRLIFFEAGESVMLRTHLNTDLILKITELLSGLGLIYDKIEFIDISEMDYLKKDLYDSETIIPR